MVKVVIVRVVIALAAMHQWTLFQMDVYNSFFEYDAEEGVFMQFPLVFGSQRDD